MFWNIENPDNYILTDEIESIIYDENVRIDYFCKNYSIMSNTFKIVETASIKNNMNLNRIQLDKISEDNVINEKSKAQKSNQVNAIGDSELHQIDRQINKFFNEYKGLKPYLPDLNILKFDEGDVKLRQEHQKKLESLENSFIMFILILLFYIFTIIFILASRDLKSDYNTKRTLEDMFDAESIHSEKDLYTYLVRKIGARFMNFDNVKNLDEYYWPEEAVFDTKFTFGTEEWGPEADTKEIASQLKNERKTVGRFKLASTIHMVINKVNTKQCLEGSTFSEYFSANETCYHAFYDASTKSTSIIDVSETLKKTLTDSSYRSPIDIAELSTYKTSAEAGINYEIQGMMGNYSGDGYHIDFDPKMDFFEFFSQMSALFPIKHYDSDYNYNPEFSGIVKNKEEFFLTNKSTRAISVFFNIYLESEDLFSLVKMVVEFSPMGYVSTTIIEKSNFVPNLFKGSYVGLEIVRIIIMLLFVYFAAYEIYRKIRVKEHWSKVVSSDTMITALLLIFFVYSFVIKINYLNTESTEIFKTDSFYVNN